MKRPNTKLSYVEVNVSKYARSIRFYDRILIPLGWERLTLYADTRDAVDRYYREIMKSNGIPSLYQDGPKGNEDYYSVLFEDLDRMKIEFVCAPRYRDKKSWPNMIKSDFDLYKTEE